MGLETQHKGSKQETSKTEKDRLSHGQEKDKTGNE